MKKIVLFVLMSVFASGYGFAAKMKVASTDTAFVFTTIKANKITPVKNQASSGTCWSFSTIGFIESELLRMGKPEVDLSEMFVVHHSYTDKADKYVRMDGTINFAGGGSFHDVLYVLGHYGIVPDSVMPGLNYGEKKHNHGELDALTSGYVKAIVGNPNKKISTAWKAGFEGILDAYLGACPKEFTVDGKKYTPQSYFQSLGINVDNYVSLTSFTHHPFYTRFAIEIPDNWRWTESYNLPLDELMQVIDNAVNNGYTVAWASDVSEKGFTRSGIGVVPETNPENMTGSDQARWVGVSDKDREDKIFKAIKPQPEITVTQELRQKAFDNHQTTDDHGMVIFGIAKDQNGKEYYMVKNSWGTDSKYKGIWYVSKTYVMYKTIDIMVHRDAVPGEILKKLAI